MSKKARREPKAIIRPHRQQVKPASLHSLKRDLVLGLLLFVFTLAVYQPAWNGKPLWDDEAHITKIELRSPGGLARIWTEPGATQQYYPLLHSVFWLEYHLWGDSTLGYHVVNILLHFISAVLLVYILRRLKIPGAWFAAAIFALHPVQVESVAWITELKNTLSGVFFLAAVLTFLKYDREREKRAYALALGLFILGLMSKSAIVTLPVSLLAVFWWKRGKIDWKHDIVPLLPFFMVGIVSGLFTAWMELKIVGAEGSEFDFTIIERCLIAGRAVWFYLSKLFWPVDLIFIYPRWHVSQAIWWQYLFPVTALILAWVFWSLRNRSRAPMAALLFFTAMLFPVLGFFNVYAFQYSFVADHFQYLACIGPIALAAGSVSALNSLKGSRQLMLGMAVLLMLGVLTWRQSGMYADDETLYQATIRKNPACWMAHNNLGLLLAELGRLDEAMAHYRKALELNPRYSEAHNNLGNLLAELRRTDDAMASYRKALELNPRYSEAHYNLGILLEELGRMDEAMAYYRKALELNPRYYGAHSNLGILLADLGRTDEAIVHFQWVLKNEPNSISAHSNLARAFELKGQLTDAAQLLQKALALVKATGDESRAQVISANLERLNKLIRSAQKSPE
jgi:protein O-mannosyl-transferase